MTGDEHNARIPQCEKCGVEQPFLLSLNDQIEVVNFICNECDYQQTRVIGSEGDDDG